MTTAAPLDLHAQELAAFLDLHEHALSASEQEIVQRGIDQAVELTGSTIGYLHYVNDDQETLELVTWSQGTLEHCQAAFDRHYPITSAGIWADTARRKQPVVHNDYQNAPNRKGYPEGHTHLLRHLGIPILEGNKLRLLMGVGNKETLYTERDAELLIQLGQLIWRLVHQRQWLDQLAREEQQRLEIKRIASISSWLWDPESQEMTFDEIIRPILHLEADAPLPTDLDSFMAYVEPSEQQAVRSFFLNLPPESGLHHEFHGFRADGSPFLASIKGRTFERSLGEHDVMVHGILQDLSDRQEFQKMRHLALHDPLTGLSNRQHLVEHLQRLQKIPTHRSDHMVALHFLDLDYFKDVNDSYGHRIGDEVLKIVAERLRHATRWNDLIVRMGGDEFLVVQFGVEEPEVVTSLGQRLIEAIGQEIVVEEHKVAIGASVGIVISPAPMSDITHLLDEADAALYQSKSGGRNRLTLYESGMHNGPRIGNL